METCKWFGVSDNWSVQQWEEHIYWSRWWSVWFYDREQFSISGWDMLFESINKSVNACYSDVTDKVSCEYRFLVWLGSVK